MNVTTRLNTELDDQLRLTFTFDAQQTDKRPMPYSMNLFIHRWGGSTVPRQRELVATMAVPTYISGYEQKLVSATLSYSRLFDREEGTTVELLDDAQAPYCVLQPMG
jgi:hypothetical protein